MSSKLWSRLSSYSQSERQEQKLAGVRKNGALAFIFLLGVAALHNWERERRIERDRKRTRERKRESCSQGRDRATQQTRECYKLGYMIGYAST